MGNRIGGQKRTHILLLTLAGLIVGVGIGIVMHLPVQHAAASNSTVSSSSGENTGAKQVVEKLTTSTRDDWMQGKIQPGRTTINNGLTVRNGEKTVDYWESPTFQLEAVKQLTIHAHIPQPSRSNITAYVITSDSPNFAGEDGAYRTIDEQPYPVNDGKNIHSPSPPPNQYYRIKFSIQRKNSTVNPPRVVNYTVVGVRNINTLLFP